MHEHERELIAALAEGSLEDETKARALLETSPEARAEYRLQLDALAALEGASPTEMTEVERARLHRELWTQVRADKAKTRSTAGIYGWSLVAAALFVVVGLAAVLGGGMLGGQDAAETFSEISDALGSLTADMATEETFAAAAEGGETASLPADSREYFDREADRLRAEQTQRAMESDGDGDLWAECLERAGIEDHRVIAMLDADENAPVVGQYLAAVPLAEPVGPDTPIDFVATDTCEVVHTSS